jgi:prophage DNA circulation protein
MTIDRFGRTLNEAAFEGVEFPTMDSAIEFGHDYVEHTAYLRPGAEIEPAGLKAIRGKLTVPMLNDIGYGTLYPSRYLALRRAIEANALGTFTHPTEGIMTACLHTVRVVATPENRSGVIFEIDWIEHNASATAGLAAFSDGHGRPERRRAVGGATRTH